MWSKLWRGSMDERTIGLDIGTHSIKAAEVEEEHGVLRLINFSSISTPPNAIRDGVITNERAVSDAIAELVGKSKIRANRAVAAVAGPTIVARYIEVPEMREAQLRQSLNFEARNYIPFSIDDAILECQIMERSENTAAGKMRVLLVAAHRQLVDSRVAAIESAGLDPIAIELEPFALIRAAIDTNINEQLRKQTVALINLGASLSDICIVRDGEFVFSRSVGIAGNSLTSAISSALRIDTSEAEDLKRNIAVATTVEDMGSAEGRVREANYAIFPILDELIRETRRSLNYYQSQFPEGSRSGLISKVVLAGGTAKLKGVERYFAHRLDLEVEVADVFRDAALEARGFESDYLSDVSPGFVLPIGLAFREIMRTKKSLLPA